MFIATICVILVGGSFVLFSVLGRMAGVRGLSKQVTDAPAEVAKRAAQTNIKITVRTPESQTVLSAISETGPVAFERVVERRYAATCELVGKLPPDRQYEIARLGNKGSIAASRCDKRGCEVRGRVVQHKLLSIERALSGTCEIELPSVQTTSHDFARVVAFGEQAPIAPGYTVTIDRPPRVPGGGVVGARARGTAP